MAGAGEQQARFTALELAAAEQLIHLSESSCSGTSGSGSGSTAAAAAFSSSVAPASSASSPRSVNHAPMPTEGGEGDDDEVGGSRPRRNRRSRPIAQIYAATDPPQPPRRGKVKGEDRNGRPGGRSRRGSTHCTCPACNYGY
ncbi:hypothetical protein U9M48_037888 [Paspalum notatum var. saurae]|uniref:Uncharacterized protein n=1 Tax=Paspalum notatum var. saurae TaxID=547442 RepID=A0AAQ3UKB5_PASNO